MRISDWSSDVCSSDLGELVRIFDLPARDLVRIGAVGGDGVAAIIAPAFRVTDADDDGFDLFDRFLLGFRRHPVDRVYALGKGRLDPVDHVADLCLGRSGEIFLGIGAAHRIRSEEHTSELQSLMRISYAVFFLKKTNISMKK